MTAIIIIGSILLFLAVLLFSPVILRFDYSGGKVGARARYLVAVIDFSPEKLARRAEKKAARAVKKEYRKQKEEEGTKDVKKKAAKDTAETVWSLIKASQRGLNILRKHLIFYRIRASIGVGGKDAYETAMSYGRFCSLASGGLALLDAMFAVRQPDIIITPDFNRETTVMDIAFRVRIAPWYAVAAGICVLVSFLKVSRRNKSKRQEVKGGKEHEPTTCY